MINWMYLASGIESSDFNDVPNLIKLISFVLLLSIWVYGFVKLYKIKEEQK